MARNMYGATSADFTLTSGGRVVPGATLTIWSARTGGTQITDLLDVDSVATTTVTSDADGSIVYYGPNDDKTVHWADSGVGGRIAIRPVDITGDPPVLSIGTVGTGAAAASLTGTSEAPVLNLTLPSAGANGVNTAAIQDSAVTSAKIADGTIVGTDINASAAIPRSAISGLPTSSTDNTLPRFDSTGGALQTSGIVVADTTNAMSGVGPITEAAMATATLGTELGDGASLTQALTGLTIGATYQVAAVSGTLTAATLDGAALTMYANATTFRASATSHTVVGTTGTATAISVKLVTARNANVAVSVGGARVSSNNSNVFVGVIPLNLVATAASSVAVGTAAGGALTTGGSNAFLGATAGNAVTSGKTNTFLGASSGLLATGGSYNTGAGASTLNTLTTGNYSSALGYSAGSAYTTGSYNLALGASAGGFGTTATISGSVCIGTNSSGTGAQATADNQIVLGVAAHNTLIAGSLEMTGSGTGIIVRSPDGTRYRLGVANGGALAIAAL